MISRKTAEELFGTPNATGNILTVKGENYTVWQVLPWKETLLLIRPRKKDTVYTRVFLKMQGDTGKTKVSQFLMENSLTGFVNGETIKDWIPDQWSDFGFWMKKMERNENEFPEVSDTSENSCLGRAATMCFSRNGRIYFVAFAVYMAKKENINGSFTGFLQIIKKSWQNLWIV